MQNITKIQAKKKRLTIEDSRFCRKLELSKNQFTMANIQQTSQEVWLPLIIPEFSKYYLVSSLARVASRECIRSYYRKDRLRPQKILKQVLNPNGYLLVRLRGDSIRRNILVHRLVAGAFIPNPENKPYINHKNGIRNDNRIENLEWCTAKENAIHSFEVLGRKAPSTGKFGKDHHRSIPIIQIDKNGSIVKEWESATQAQRAGFGQANIAAVARGRRKTAYGFIWKYKQPCKPNC